MILKTLSLLLVMSCTPKPGQAGCPPLLLKDFSITIENQKQAEKIFQEYFSEEKGFPKFDAKHIGIDDSPSCSGSSWLKKTCYFYYDWYGFGPSGVGGYLHPDGRLVKRSYCK